MKNAAILIVLIVIGAAGAWYWSVQVDRKAVQETRVLPPEPVKPDSGPRPEDIRHPVPEPRTEPEPESGPPPEPLPSLAESDEAVAGVLESMLGDESFERWFIRDMLISRAVASVDSLTSAQVAPLMLPVKPAPGKFQGAGVG